MNNYHENNKLDEWMWIWGKKSSWTNPKIGMNECEETQMIMNISQWGERILLARAVLFPASPIAPWEGANWETKAALFTEFFGPS